MYFITVLSHKFSKKVYVTFKYKKALPTLKWQGFLYIIYLITMNLIYFFCNNLGKKYPLIQSKFLTHICT